MLFGLVWDVFSVLRPSHSATTRDFESGAGSGGSSWRSPTGDHPPRTSIGFLLVFEQRVVGQWSFGPVLGRRIMNGLAQIANSFRV